MMKLSTASEQSGHFEEGSCWSDPIWRFPVTTAGSRRSVFSMNWCIPVDGGIFTDHEHALALEAWKRVLWTMLVTPPDGHPRKGNFCGKFGTALRFLVPWMVATGRRDLGELDRHAFGEFVDALSAKIVEDDEEDEVEALVEDGVTDQAVASYLNVYSLPYIARQALSTAGFRHPVEDPLGGRSPLTIAKEVSRKVVRQTPEVPDPVFVASLNAAMTILDAPWLEPLIDLANNLSSMPERFHDVQCSAFAKSHLPSASMYGSLPRLFRTTLVEVRTACQILIQATSALRVSEICGIEAGERDAVTGLPGCVKVERTFDDEFEVFSLNGQLFKHTPSSEPMTWVLGMRPSGSTYLPPPVRAIDVLFRLDAGWRRLAGCDALLVQFTTVKNTPSEARDLAPATTGNIRKLQHRWLTETGCASADQRITTHMWRKTFARYLVRVSADLLPAISHHLKHMSIAMTEVGYCKPDPAVRRLIEDARVEEAGSVILGAITGRKRVEGPVASEIRALGEELSARLGNRTAEDIASDVEAEVRERRIELYGNGIGWCVFRSESARCHLLAAEPMPAFLRLAPAFAQRRPEVCQKCANFGIGDEHVGFWRARRSTLSDRLDASGSGTPASVKVALQRSIERCDIVLSWMREGGHV